MVITGRDTKLGTWFKSSSISSKPKYISNKFCQKKLTTLKFRRFLEYITSKLENSGHEFFLVSILLHPRHPELEMTWIEVSVLKVLQKETLALVSISIDFKWRIKHGRAEIRSRAREEKFLISKQPSLILFIYKHLPNKKKPTEFAFQKENALPSIHGAK